MGKQNADQFYSHSLVGGGWLSPKSSRHSQDLDSDGNGSSWLKPQVGSLSGTTLPDTHHGVAISSTIGDIVDVTEVDRRFRLVGKQIDPQKGFLPSPEHVWVCPECQLKLQHKNGDGLSQLKSWHMKSRHPEFRRDLIRENQKADAYVPSTSIPRQDRQWSCPICDAGLYALPPQDMKRAIQAHCADQRPGETRRSLAIRLLKGIKKPAVGRRALQKAQDVRNTKYETHDCVLLPQETKDKAERGRVNFCKKCLSRLGRHGDKINNLTCEQRLERLKTNPWVKKMKRDWWERLVKRDPSYADLFLKETGWKRNDLEALLAPVYRSEADRRWGEKRKRAWQSDQAKRKKQKQTKKTAK